MGENNMYIQIHTLIRNRSIEYRRYERKYSRTKLQDSGVFIYDIYVTIYKTYKHMIYYLINSNSKYKHLKNINLAKDRNSDIVIISEEK